MSENKTIITKNNFSTVDMSYGLGNKLFNNKQQHTLQRVLSENVVVCCVCACCGLSTRRFLAGCAGDSAAWSDWWH